MKVRSRVSIFALTLSLLPLLIVTLVLGWFSYSSAKDALEKEIENNLISRRDAKKSELEAYFQTVNDQLLSQAQSTMLIEAAKGFRNEFLSETFQQASLSNLSSFSNLSEFSETAIAGIPESVKQSLDQYYYNDFIERYKEKNVNKETDINAIVGNLSNRAKWFQYYYISNNEESLGEKDNMLSSPLGSGYDQTHEKYHPPIQGFLKRFGFYDIFIVDPDSGHIVYSVFKELDYGTSLKSGPYRNSGLAQAFKQALELGTNREVTTVDFRSYLPSYNDNAAFAATPIVENGERVGILVYQLALDKINQLMTLKQEWQDHGYGKTGEVYLVGSDLNMRSDSRLFVERPEDFRRWGTRSNFGAEATNTIMAKGTTIGLLPVSTQASLASREGQTGVARYRNYTGEPVLGAYAPLSINGLSWAIVAEVYESEAFSGVGEIASLIKLYGGITFLAVMFIATGAGLWFARGIARPIAELSETVRAISSQNDLTLHVHEMGGEEVRQAAKSVNDLIERLRQNFSEINTSSLKLAQTADNMMGLMKTSLEVTDTQNAECSKVAQSTEQMEVAANEVARNAGETATQTQEANKLSNTLGDLVERTASSTETVAEEIESASDALETLAEKSNDIGSVLDVIQSIAEQTNLLALNAAIEAARAGDQGRGFAVVADEVRVLAQRTQDATGEISTMIESLQSNSSTAVKAMRLGHTTVKNNVEIAEESRHSLSETVAVIQKIAFMNEQVATAAEEQTNIIQGITESTHDLNRLTESSSDKSSELSNISSQLHDLAGNLKTMVSAYKV
ncbi:methyl-accepting chemotaxis protein [Pseudoteredinibacter isoporae]|uniref:Methyl-accepting chemotaxis protein n=1 Tax=Pseudoteredinibacter isoporae TaxID=570281 RepID=A0A7X0JY08_9GAMM|nr:methyl-accepting chemotaxis protein [Pseudoteredinibacter isoporae]MBB6523814.1 methyl-accepting chemotaxis protein [Pseudoteredinibacter isoporae]NHO89334.1 HAMP domain-containing protein [Pseudoteredinibacter isoporae]NIB22441.1 HAMP domain-containing protein [Pseudoteredinibacter isoporae]